jgi:hypothetical protein
MVASTLHYPKLYKPLYERLKEDRLVSDDLDPVLSTFTPKNIQHNRSQLLYTLNDPFIVDFRSARDFSVVTEQGMEVIQLFGLFFEDRHRISSNRPYTGAYTNHLLSILFD